MKGLGFVILSVMLLSVVSATVVEYQRPCGDVDKVDICTWTTVSGSPLALPLGNTHYYSGCPDLDKKTYWPLDTNTTAVCKFDGDELDNAMLYVSIDNDIISCTLNGVQVIGATAHENCAPEDPRDGFNADLSSNVIAGTNELVCTVKDRGVMSHFDACVVEYETPQVPEFGVIAGMVTVLGAFAVFFMVRRK